MYRRSRQAPQQRVGEGQQMRPAAPPPAERGSRLAAVTAVAAGFVVSHWLSRSPAGSDGIPQDAAFDDTAAYPDPYSDPRAYEGNVDAGQHTTVGAPATDPLGPKENRRELPGVTVREGGEKD